MNPLLSKLQPYPFERLRKLFADVTPNPAYPAISLGIGEPKHPTPPFIQQALADATREGAALRIDLERCEVVAPGGAEAQGRTGPNWIFANASPTQGGIGMYTQVGPDSNGNPPLLAATSASGRASSEAARIGISSTAAYRSLIVSSARRCAPRNWAEVRRGRLVMVGIVLVSFCLCLMLRMR